MKSNYDYDLIVIGTGEAGSTAAQICSAAGWKVAISDDNPFGGTCSLRGCNPKRTLAGAVLQTGMSMWLVMLMLREYN